MLAFFSACTVGPVYEPPAVDVPEEWDQDTTSLNTTPSEITWWERLNDPALDALIAEASGQNFDLKIAALQVAKACTAASGKKAELYPHIDASAACGRAVLSKQALHDILGAGSHPKRAVNYYEIGLDLDWEIDFFGLSLREIAALKANEEAIQEAYCGVWLTLSAEIAKTYIRLRSLQQSLQFSEELIRLEKERLALSEGLLERGLIDASDFNRAKAELVKLSADPGSIKLEITQMLYRLAILLGGPPGKLTSCLQTLSPLPALPCLGCVGTPSELLRRRPDIRKAERELAAATEREGAAIAALFPRFSLQGFIGDISTHAGSLFKPASATCLAGPQVLVPVFNSRLLLQDVEYNKLETQIALYNYQKTVLEALEETESAIAAFKTAEERATRLAEACKHYEEALAAAEELYSRGVVDRFKTIDARKALLNSQNTLNEANTHLLLQYILLNKSLG